MDNKFVNQNIEPLNTKITKKEITVEQRVTKIKEILNNRDLRKALKDTPLSSTDLKGKIYILLMKWKATSLIIALKKKR